MDSKISLPTNLTLPAGYSLGAHAGGSSYWLIRHEDDKCVRCELRPDLEQVEEVDLDLPDPREMDGQDVLAAIEAAFEG